MIFSAAKWRYSVAQGKETGLTIMQTFVVRVLRISTLVFFDLLFRFFFSFRSQPRNYFSTKIIYTGFSKVGVTMGGENGLVEIGL